MKITDSPTQLQFPTGPHEDVLTSAINADAPIRFSCRDGFCGQCRGEVLAGCYAAGRDGPLRDVPPGGAPQPVLMCQTYPRSDLAIRMPHAGDASSAVRAARIEAVEPVAADIAVVRLGLLDANPFPYEAGQCVAIRWPANGYKPFSLARACDGGRTLELHVRKVAGGDFTEWLFADGGQRAVGAIVGLEGPLGEFGWRSPAARPVLLMAGGTGFAPLAAMIEAERLWAGERPVHLYWGGRTPADLYADARCRAWAAANPRFRYVPVLSGDAAVEGFRRGTVVDAAMADVASLDDADVYACGTPAMVAAAKAAFVGARGLRPERFFADPFSPPVARHAGRDALVRLNLRWADGGRGHLMAAEGQRLLGALIRSGLALQHLCGGNAVCATCAVTVHARNGDPAAARGEEEADLLDFLDAAPGTRLACQLRLGHAFDQAEVALPGPSPLGDPARSQPEAR
ncbi:2Fe-2S iron-sulfur cluster-binding protein [Burkholderia sp. Ac-20379]|uniref:2Fe-2S iron-sulfur cluster-binding protein n=1 Tax=Burkholderia sp. Ac-20379 TaxID=2703900 RepID=UPI001982511A|nr:2Fe-2S iron-sulfur cluster binding domain-containing protein [Burkholderia sp. Ac-20379]